MNYPILNHLALIISNKMAETTDAITSMMENLSLSKSDSTTEPTPANPWLKLIDLDKAIEFDKYVRKSGFIPVANIVKDDEVFENGKNKGKKKRNTIIQFKPIIDKKEYENEETEWIYIFTIDNKIVKIGGTRTGLKGRVGSYLCGHHIPERGKSGKCSVTNAFIYNTFEYYLNRGHTIQMLGYKLPKKTFEINVFGEGSKEYPAQVYHIYEAAYLEDFKKIYKSIPDLSFNYMPTSKK